MFLHAIGASLAESFNLVFNIWHIEIMMPSVIDDVSRCVDNNFEVSFEIFVVFLCLRLCLTVGRIDLRIALYNSNLFLIDSCEDWI